MSIFTITIPTRVGDRTQLSSFTVKTEKSFTERMALKQGYDGQPLRYVKVQPKADAPKQISSRKHIRKIITPDEVQSLYPTGETDSDGQFVYVVVPKKSLKDRFGRDKTMNIVRVIPKSKVDFRYFDGKHSALNLYTASKQKVNQTEQQLYQLVHFGLQENDEVLLVRYTANNNEHHAVVYADDDGLRMSVMIPSDRQKSRTQVQKVGSDRPVQYNRAYKKLLGDLYSPDLRPEDFKDPYGEALQSIVDAALKGEVYEPPKVQKTPGIKSSLDWLFDDEPASGKSGSGSGGSTDPKTPQKRARVPSHQQRKRVRGPSSKSESSDSSDSSSELAALLYYVRSAYHNAASSDSK